jgi:hypothetical protein
MDNDTRPLLQRHSAGRRRLIVPDTYTTQVYRANRHVYDNPNIQNRGFQQQLAIQEAEKILESDPQAFLGEAINEDPDQGETFLGNVLKLLAKLPCTAIPGDLLDVYDDACTARDKLIKEATLPLAQRRYPELF